MAKANGSWRKAARRAGWSAQDMRVARRAGYGPNSPDYGGVPRWLDQRWTGPTRAIPGGVGNTDIVGGYIAGTGQLASWRESGTAVGAAVTTPGVATVATGVAANTVGPITPGLSNPDTGRINDPFVAPALAGTTTSAIAGITQQEYGDLPWWARLFDYEDSYGKTGQGPGGDSPIESAWDGFLGAMGWATNTLSAATVAAMSAAPGGSRTLDWTEAGEVSVGQMVANEVASPDSAIGGLLAAGGNPAGVVGAGANPLGAPVNPIGALGRAAHEANPDVIGPWGNPVYGEGFDITNADQREAAFSNDFYGKWGSGLTDAAFAWWADPTVVGGKALKIARITTVDRAVVSANDLYRLYDDIGKGSLATDEAAMKAAPAASAFLHWVGGYGDIRNQPSLSEILDHQVVANSSSREALGSALRGAANYEERALILRAAYRDTSAINELITVRADLADILARESRDMLVDKLRADPNLVGPAIQRAAATVIDTRERLSQVIKNHDGSQAAEDAMITAYDDYQKALDEEIAINNFEIRDPVADPLTPEEWDAADGLVAQMLMRDPDMNRAFEDALAAATSRVTSNNQAFVDDIAGSLLNAPKGFGSGKIGNVAERVRQSNARIRETSRGMVDGGWTQQKFTAKGLYARAGIVISRTTNEAPAGYLGLRNGREFESFREIRAMVDSLDSFTKDDAGRAARDRVLDLWVGARTEEQRLTALDSILETVNERLAVYHGLDQGAVQHAMRHGQEQLAKLTESIRKKGRFIDKETGDISFIPEVQALLSDGTYLLNYRAVERQLRIVQKQNAVKAAEFAGEHTKAAMLQGGLLLSEGANVGINLTQNILRAVQNVWRPFVLLRLAYPIRNTMEGQFRAMAYTNSISPLIGATVNLWHGTRNVADSTATRLTARQGSRRFSKWRDKQAIALDGHIEGLEQILDNTEEMLRVFDPTAYADENLANIAMQALQQQIDDVTIHLTAAQARRADLDDTVTALMDYRNAPERTRRRRYDKTESLVDGRSVNNAFSDPERAPIDLRLLSSDGSTRAMVSGITSTNRRWLMAERSANNVVVKWSDKPEQQAQYFDGLATSMNALADSPIGNRVMRSLITRGDLDTVADEVGAWLMGDGYQYAQRLGIENLGFAKRYAYMQAANIRQWAPTDDLLALALDGKRNGRKITGQEADRVLTPLIVDGLIPSDVVGNLVMEQGTATATDVMRKLSDWMFERLGTMPEDAFVRQPFYGQQFQQYRDQAIRLMEDTTGPVTLADLQRIEAEAHRRALKDTKTQLFTIDRRTDLAQTGEWFVPFLSAYQNSVTAVGRLSFRDPSLPARIALIWQSPQDAGIEDEEGNMLFPVPYNFLPDGPIKEAIKQTGGMMIPKDSLATAVLPVQAPQAGPVFQIAASEMMKGAWGVSPATPGILQGLPGGVGDGIWKVTRAALFGEEGDVSARTLSYDKVLPGFGRTLDALLWKEDQSSAYATNYTRIMQTEVLRWMAGERDEDDFPTADEIQNKTDGLYWLRLLGNLGPIPTPPQYQYDAEPLVDAYSRFMDLYGDQADEKFIDVYGEQVLYVMKIGGTRNNMGFGTGTLSEEEARTNQGIIKQIAPTIPEDDLETLAILSDSFGTQEEYDGSVRAVQLSNTIPGTTVPQRELVSPGQQQYEAGKQMGWSMYFKIDDRYRALLNERGLTNFSQAGAEDLAEQRNAEIQAMLDNPLLKGWKDDYDVPGSTRAASAVHVIENALNDDEFMARHAEDSKWQGAYAYTTGRKAIIDELTARGRNGGSRELTAQDNSDLLERWVATQEQIASTFVGWDKVYLRFFERDTQLRGSA